MMDSIGIIIADDEESVRVFLKEYIDFNDLGLSLLGVAADGASLLRSVENLSPDIVIINIRLLKQHGLELLQKTGKRDFDCKFVVISAIEDLNQIEYFSSIGCIIDFFLLKPIKEASLNSFLTILTKYLLIERERGIVTKEDIHTMFFKYRIILQRLCLINILHGDEPPKDAETMMDKYGIEFRCNAFQCCAILFGNSDEKLDTQTQNLNSNVSEQHLFRIFRFTRELLPEGADLISCIENNLFFIVINFDGDDSKYMLKRYKEIYEFAKNRFCRNKAVKIILGISEIHKNIKDLGLALNESARATYFRLALKNETIIYYSDTLIIPHKYPSKEWNVLLKNFEAALQAYDTEKSQKIIAAVISTDTHAGEIAELILIIEKSLLNPINVPNYFNKDSMEQQRNNLYLGIQNAFSISQMKEHIMKSIMQIIQHHKHVPEQYYTKPVEDAIRFMKKYYMERIDLEKVASQVQLNPVYFSNLFKKETGQNFVTYLNMIKIAKAKEILVHSTKNVSEISDALGFNDMHYFSRLFHKNVGMPPLKYRSVHG
jgi:two-component system response regulator YesN